MIDIEKKALIVIRTGIRAIKSNMETLLTDSGRGRDIQDDELREMYYQLNLMSVQLTERIEMPEPAEIALEDHVPGAVVEPRDIPERVIDDDFDV